jgi:putative ABC transport system permease protein
MVMWLLAIKAMLADRGKLLTSMLGITFSVVLINLQGGLLLGLLKKASLLVDYGKADIWIGHRHSNNVDIGTYIPERWIHRLRGIEGVERAEPYVVFFAQISMPNGRTEGVVVVGSEPSTLLGNAHEMKDGDPRAIRSPDGVLVDYYDREKLGNCKIGDVREINLRRARIVGFTQGIVGFTTSPYVFTTLEQARNKYGVLFGLPPDHCSYYLVKAKPGTDLTALCARIRARVPELDVYDKETYSLMCMKYWLTRTGIGISFGLAAFLGLLVGLAVVAQTLYASVAERIKEFGTLKAMGADDRCIARFFLAQALGNAFLGSVLGLAASWVIGGLMTSPRAPVILTWQVAAGSVFVICLVCVAASWLPYWRIRRIDAACVLRL